MSQPTEHRKVVIVGSGPAGYTAALYSARALLQPLLFMGPQPGGQLTITTEVENYPGFEHGIMGPDLVEVMKKQCARFGTTLVDGSVTSVDLSSRPFRVTAEGLSVTADTLIIATGASANWLEHPSVERLKNKGISACATCDGFFFRGKKLGVVGGGDSAVEEASFLTKYGTEVHLIVRRDQLRASKIMQDRAINHPKIKIRWNTVIDECLGETQLTGLRLKSTVTGETTTEDFGGLFMAIGHTPNSAFVKDQLPSTPTGYLLTMPGRTATRIPGVFACGDVVDSYYRQAVTAAGSGCAAAIEAERFLETGEMPEPPMTWAGAPVHHA